MVDIIPPRSSTLTLKMRSSSAIISLLLLPLSTFAAPIVSSTNDGAILSKPDSATELKERTLPAGWENLNLGGFGGFGGKKAVAPAPPVSDPMIVSKPLVGSESIVKSWDDGSAKPGPVPPPTYEPIVKGWEPYQHSDWNKRHEPLAVERAFVESAPAPAHDS